MDPALLIFIYIFEIENHFLKKGFEIVTYFISFIIKTKKTIKYVFIQEKIGLLKK